MWKNLSGASNIKQFSFSFPPFLTSASFFLWPARNLRAAFHVKIFTNSSVLGVLVSSIQFFGCSFHNFFYLWKMLLNAHKNKCKVTGWALSGGKNQFVLRQKLMLRYQKTIQEMI